MEVAMREIDHAGILALRERFGEQCSTSSAVLAAHGEVESYHAAQPPDAVLFARATQDVSDALRLCATHRLPVIPFGAGSSLEGHTLAPHGGVSLDLSGMRRIIEVRAEDLDVTVEAGVTHPELNEHLGPMGLFFPVDPGAPATLGGMAATRASGTTTVGYGTMRDAVRALTVVTPDGEVIRTGSRAPKSSAGYDLTHLFVGSEGTLGVITELTLRVHGIPEVIAAAVVAFPELSGAVDTVVALRQMAIPVARVELLARGQMAAAVAFSELEDMRIADTLFLEFHGSQVTVEDHAAAVEAIAAAHGGSDFRWATQQEDRDRLWTARHQVMYANKAARPGCQIVASDVCVPIGELTDAILTAEHELSELQLQGNIVGHVGDGNFHIGYLVDPEDSDEAARVTEHHRRMVERALAVGGTCTGEHGIGLGKRGFLVAEHGDGAVEVMRRIKHALDPLGIMNPGKLLP
jgi:D-lactate dehydrogenase (cytochrome)